MQLKQIRSIADNFEDITKISSHLRVVVAADFLTLVPTRQWHCSIYKLNWD